MSFRAVARRAASRAAAFVLLLAAVAFVAPAHAYPRICISADTLLFGERAVGTSTPQSATVESCGDEPWTFTDVSIHAATGAAWHVDTACRTGMTLAPGASCRIDVRFEPTAAGQTSGALWLRNTTSTATQLVTFYGRGVDARAGTASLVFEPAPLDVGIAEIGASGEPAPLRLRNAGSAAMTLSRLVVNGPDAFEFVPALDAGGCIEGRVVAPGASCALAIRFAPRGLGTRRAQLVVDSPQLPALAILPMQGQGIETAIATTVDVVEFHHPPSGQYFLSADTAEIAFLDRGGPGGAWARTGLAFRAYAAGRAPAGAAPVCRFFGTPGVGPDSHFYTLDAAECEAVKANPFWIDEGVAFAARPATGGACADGDVAISRFWRAGAVVTASRHRYVADAAIAASALLQGWIPEGVVFCAMRWQ